jgi:hypothetical protein
MSLSRYVKILIGKRIHAGWLNTRRIQEEKASVDVTFQYLIKSVSK